MPTEKSQEKKGAPLGLDTHYLEMSWVQVRGKKVTALTIRIINFIFQDY